MVILLQGAPAACAMRATACEGFTFGESVYLWSSKPLATLTLLAFLGRAVRLTMAFLGAVACDMLSTCFASASAVRTLRDRTTFRCDFVKLTIYLKSVADSLNRGA